MIIVQGVMKGRSHEVPTGHFTNVGCTGTSSSETQTASYKLKQGWFARKYVQGILPDISCFMIITAYSHLTISRHLDRGSCHPGNSKASACEGLFRAWSYQLRTQCRVPNLVLRTQMSFRIQFPSLTLQSRDEPLHLR